MVSLFAKIYFLLTAISFFLLIDGLPMLNFYLSFKILVLSTAFVLSLTLPFLIMMIAKLLLLNFLETLTLGVIVVSILLTFFSLVNYLKLTLLSLKLLTLMTLGILLLMMNPTAPFVIIPIVLALLKPFSRIKSLIGFRLESTNTHKIENFISLFTIMCTALLWLTIIGVDYSKNKHHYSLKVHDTRKTKSGHIVRRYSFFSLGLTIFKLCYYNYTNFKLKFDFLLYDI